MSLKIDVAMAHQIMFCADTTYAGSAPLSFNGTQHMKESEPLQVYQLSHLCIKMIAVPLKFQKDSSNGK
jgi:hypothetical protein